LACVLRPPKPPAAGGDSLAVGPNLIEEMLKVTDKDGNMLRYPDGEPCKQVLGPNDSPRQIAARLARGHRREYGGRGFWGDIPPGKGAPV